MKLWWPNTAIPAGTGPWPQPAAGNEGRTGSYQGAAAETVTRAKLCSADFQTPTPTVVEVSVTLPSSGIEVDFAALASGLSGGTLIFEYGSGRTFRSVECDLRSGSYQLPPSEQVRVLVSTYGIDGGPLAMLVVASLVEGQHIAPTLPTYTYSAVVPIASPADVTVPDAAKFVDCWVTDSQLLYGSGAPRVSLYGAVGSQVVRDYANAVWAPPFPAALFATSGGSTRTITLATTVEKRCVVQFELEL